MILQKQFFYLVKTLKLNPEEIYFTHYYTISWKLGLEPGTLNKKETYTFLKLNPGTKT